MSVVSESVRLAIVVRAGHRCEYCHLPTRGQVATFPVDHVIPRIAGGSDELPNLALACPHCNAHKWTATEAHDPASNEIVRLFNPRLDSWEEHFGWSRPSPGQLMARTAIARATIERLRINDTDMIALRVLLTELGWFSENVS